MTHWQMAKNAFVEPYALGNCINQVMIINFKFVHARFGRWLVNCMPQHGCVMLCASRYSVWRYGIVKSPVWWVKSCYFSTECFFWNITITWQTLDGYVDIRIFSSKKHVLNCFDTIRPSQWMPKTKKARDLRLTSVGHAEVLRRWRRTATAKSRTLVEVCWNR